MTTLAKCDKCKKLEKVDLTYNNRRFPLGWVSTKDRDICLECQQKDEIGHAGIEKSTITTNRGEYYACPCCGELNKTHSSVTYHRSAFGYRYKTIGGQSYD